MFLVLFVMLVFPFLVSLTGVTPFSAISAFAVTLLVLVFVLVFMLVLLFIPRQQLFFCISIPRGIYTYKISTTIKKTRAMHACIKPEFNYLTGTKVTVSSSPSSSII